MELDRSVNEKACNASAGGAGPSLDALQAASTSFSAQPSSLPQPSACAASAASEACGVAPRLRMAKAFAVCSCEFSYGIT